MSSFSGAPLLRACRVKKWRLYGIIVEPVEGDFIVKIGVSVDPFERLCSLRAGICLPPALVISPEAKRGDVYAAESGAHKDLEDHNTFGEWFRFLLDEKQTFHDAVRINWMRHTGTPFKWQAFSREQVDASLKEAQRLKNSRRKYKHGEGYENIKTFA